MSAARPEGAGAVMASRVHGEVEADDARTALYRRLDYFPTPPWAARAGGELLRHLDPEAQTIWEPACGEGHMAAPLAETFEVFASDIYSFGFGASIDFLHEGGWAASMAAVTEPDWIVTNPPFASASAFIRLGLVRARRGVAMLMRLQALEGGPRNGRYKLLFGSEPLTRVAVFSERPAMLLGRWQPEATTASGYAWFFWMKGAAPMPPIGIPPGTKARLTRPDDAARFGWKSDAGLLGAMEAPGPDDEDDSGVNDLEQAA